MEAEMVTKFEPRTCEAQLGELVRVNPKTNGVWGDGAICQVTSVFNKRPADRDQFVEIRHPEYGFGEFRVSALLFEVKEELEREAIVVKHDTPSKSLEHSSFVGYDAQTGRVTLMFWRHEPPMTDGLSVSIYLTPECALKLADDIHKSVSA